jgi:AcrR family transcriptional regulator
MAELAAAGPAAPHLAAPASAGPQPAMPGLGVPQLAMPGARTAAESDGRRLRREQNREAVIDALLALFSAGQYQPSSAEIAAAAGLSPRSLFRYFDDIEDLYHAAADRYLRAALPLFQLSVGPQDQLADKIQAVAHSRVRVYERVAETSRALRVGASRNELLAAGMARVRTVLRGQLSELFAPELAGRNEFVLPAVEVLCSFSAYDRLVSESGLSPEAVAATLVAALTALLDGDPDVS